MLGEEHGARSEQLDRAVLETGEPIGNIEWEMADQTGARHWLLVAKSPLRDAFDRSRAS